jgi:glucans biosynthesis protein
MPAGMEAIGYSEYQKIQFRPARTLWINAEQTIGLQLFHRGYLYKTKIPISVVRDGVGTQIAYSASLFRFGDVRPLSDDPDIGFAGLRLVRRSSISAKASEFAVFLGASYFRALGENQGYGLSARGLALGTGQATPEEFPVFREFWVEASPARDAVSVYALLDSASATGAYAFLVRTGAATRMRVHSRIYPRKTLKEVGFAPATSMFHFDANSSRHVDDYRPQVHDSNGLLILNGSGETIWRPLSNPSSIQISDFVDENPRGFGLLQRDRDFEHYQDLWARYERRPNLWITPRGNWGSGSVRLVEIPTGSEFFDNIVAFWRPSAPLKAGAEINIDYDLEWGSGPPNADRIFVASTRQGKVLGASRPDLRQFVIDYVDPMLPELPYGPRRVSRKPDFEVTTSDGEIKSELVMRHGQGWRLMFQLDAQGSSHAELRAELKGQRTAETWLFRWVAD